MNASIDRITVLLIDDQPLIGQAVRAMLADQADLAFHYCQNPTEAVRLANQIGPTVILQDLVMPELDGLTLLKFLRANPTTRKVPIIVLSTKEDAVIKAQAFKLGANDYLVKLPDALELLARVRYHSAAYLNGVQRDRAMHELAEANATISSLNTRLQSENLRMGAELEVSRRLQQLLLPTDAELAAISDLELACYMEPADEVGGDYYDVLAYPGGVKIGIGDVTGHGLESGVLAIMAQMGVRTLLAAQEQDSRRFLNILNQAIYANLARLGLDKSMSFSLLDYRAGELSVCGQHEDLVVVRNGQASRHSTNDLGLPLGMLEDLGEYLGESRLAIAPGDGVVLYSDGITEAENRAGELYGIERLCRAAERHWRQPAERIKQGILAELRDHIGDHRIYDDITLVVMKRRAITDNSAA
jgi:sigma-B regulation protein RsbU (phosphoserine phosphatase)